MDKEGNPIEGAYIWPCVPRFRFYPSTTIDALCEYRYGFGDHEIEEKHYGLYKSEDEVPDVVADEVPDVVADVTVPAPAVTAPAKPDVIDFEDEI